MADLSYHFAIAFLFCHELDAVRKSEWQMLFVLKRLSNSKARWWFVMLHFPLLLLVFWTMSGEGMAVEIVKAVLAAFCAIHWAIHFRLRKLGRCFFISTPSKALIDLSGVFGLVYLMFFFAKG